MDIKVMQDRMEYELAITKDYLNNTIDPELNRYFAGRFHGVVAMIYNASGKVNYVKIRNDNLLKVTNVNISWIDA